MSELILPARPQLELPRIELPEVPSLGKLLDGVRGKLRDLGLVMSGFSDAQELVVLDSVFGDAAINLNTAPTYLALLTSAAGETDTGATLVEATYTGYGRKSLSAADMNAAAAGSKANGVQQVFANCTALSSVIIGWAVCTTSGTGTGQVVVFGTCASTTISTTQTPPQVAVGGLVVNLD